MRFFKRQPNYPDFFADQCCDIVFYRAMVVCVLERTQYALAV